jgi:hypothetical protein
MSHIIFLTEDLIVLLRVLSVVLLMDHNWSHDDRKTITMADAHEILGITDAAYIWSAGLLSSFAGVWVITSFIALIIPPLNVIRQAVRKPVQPHLCSEPSLESLALRSSECPSTLVALVPKAFPCGCDRSA